MSVDLDDWQRERATILRTDGAIRRQACPKCGAPEGEDCHSSGWWPTTFHAARKRAAGL